MRALQRRVATFALSQSGMGVWDSGGGAPADVGPGLSPFTPGKLIGIL